jgi:ribonuclease H / adenosylcobalamin/alpha-ribazole phosphatase
MSNDQQRMARLFLVRHGETAQNIQMRYLGTCDEPLTDNGMRQAQLVADALSRIPISLVVSSPLRRAADTAARIQEACGADLKLDPRLAEGSFGNWEGRTRDEVLKLGGNDAALLARWESDPSFSPPGGESILMIQKRIVSLVEDLTAEHPAESVVLVSHVGPIKALLSAVLDIPLQATRRLFLDPATISVVEWGTHPLMRLFNSHAHLGWQSARWME